MLERDVREDDDSGVEHVGRVVAPTEPRFDDGDIDLLRRELGEGGGGQHLELRGAVGVRPDTREGLVEVGVGSVDLDPLRPAADMGRDVGPDSQSFGV